MTATTLSLEEIQDALSAIVDGAADRDLTDEEEAQVETLEADLATAKAKRERTEAIRARIAENRRIVTPALHVKTPDTASDTLDAAFTAYLRSGKENADLQQLRAAQSEGTPSEGGFLVPDGFRQKIVARLKAFGGLANVVDSITTETGNNLPWLTEGDDTSSVGEVVDEGNTFAGGNDLSYGVASLGAYSYMAGGASGTPLRLSRELVQDAAFDVVGRVTDKLGIRMARIQSQHIVSGTGVKQPQGIVTGRTGVTTAANNALTYKDILNWIHSVDPAYRGDGCRWAFNDAALQTIEGLLDANGRPLIKASTDSMSGAPSGPTLLGYPITVDQGFSNFTNNSPSINWGVFGNLQTGYVIRNVRSIELLVNPYSRMQQRQIEYSAWFRFDAVQQDTNAYIALTGHS